MVGLCLSAFFGFAIGWMNIGVFYVFGIPVFGLLIGLILIAASRAQIGVKALSALLPLPMVVLGFFGWYQFSKGPSETFLIPSGYRGEIVVFFDEPCGKQVVSENGRRIYEIDKDGILITQFVKRRGLLDQEFFYVEENGIRNQLPYFLTQNLGPKNDERNGLDSNLQRLRHTVGVFWSYGSETYYISQDSMAFVVNDFEYFKKDENESWQEIKDFSKLAEQKLKQCRQSQ